MISVDVRDVKRLENHLVVMKERAFPFATKQAINTSAFKVREFAQENIRNSMIRRNRFTEASVRVEQARTLRISQQRATIGSIAKYMLDQEFGGIKRKRGSEGVSIATGYSAGQESTSKRTRLPRRANTLQAISLANKKKKGRSRVQQNFIAIREASKSSNKFVYLDLGKRKGIFKVIGGMARPKIKMVHDLTRSSVAIPKNPWLYPAVRRAEAMMPSIYYEALEAQLRRHNLMGY